MTGQCPPSKTTIDRSFATDPPACLATFGAAKSAGESYGAVILNLGNEVKVRDDCIDLVNDWIASERKARAMERPGA